MGQQQILLVILVTIIVGIATIVAIVNMQSSHDAAIYEAIQQDILQAQSQSIAYIKKPVMMGGGGGSYIGMTLNDILLPEENDNAKYELEEVNTDSFIITATTPYGLLLTATINGESVDWDRE
jgi:hypothetical protein